MTLVSSEEHQNACTKSPHQHKLNGIFSKKKRARKKIALNHLSQ